MIRESKTPNIYFKEDFSKICQLKTLESTLFNMKGGLYRLLELNVSNPARSKGFSSSMVWSNFFLPPVQMTTADIF